MFVDQRAPAPCPIALPVHENMPADSPPERRLSPVIFQHRFPIMEDAEITSLNNVGERAADFLKVGLRIQIFVRRQA